MKCDMKCQKIHLQVVVTATYVHKRCIHSAVRYLGVTIDQYLKWNIHIDVIIKYIIIIISIKLFSRFKTLNSVLLPNTLKMVFRTIAQ